MIQASAPQTTETATLWGAWSPDAPPNILPSATFSYWVDGRQWAQNYYGRNWEQFVSLRRVSPEQAREIAARNAASLAYANTFAALMAPPPERPKPGRLSDGNRHILGVVLMALFGCAAGDAVGHAGLGYCLLWSAGIAGIGLGIWLCLPYCRVDDGKGQGR